MTRLAEVTVWWVVLTAAYVTTLGAFTVPEFAVAAGVGLLCAVCAVAARRATRARWSPDPRWAAWLVPLPAAVAADTVRLLSRLPRGGTVRDLPTPRDESPDRAAFRRAWGTVVLSSSPGSVVLDWPPDGPLTIHELGSGPPHLERRVTRP
ncbi:hypothetical protein ODJ79_21235 [Actinoplanes sp. KI2]|uniref:hypothetical protein n=1 Tax=Actinoplanes sp. KI2 TaxID=2983315 RepID=UPI0021D5E6D6|nr:hypothetical protein [Actinoplanes sp. KI2]MCU7726260.1 hypothetical protein [Actinoplanes sp. KI2]